MQKIITVGDVHAKVSNTQLISLLFCKLIELVMKERPTFVVFLGDILNDHSRMSLQATANVFRAFAALESVANQVGASVVVLVGNHDMTNNTEICPQDHALEGLKRRNIHVVDKPHGIQTDDGWLFFYPYLPPGQLVERSAGTSKGLAVFCHQEFRGAKLGAIESTVGDEWPKEAPLAISGHIHEYDRLAPNVIYVGTPYQQAFGDDGRKTVSIFEIESQAEWTETRVDLELPRRLQVTVNVDQAAGSLKFEEKDDWQAVRVNIEDVSEKITKFKNSKRYEELRKKAQVIFRSTDIITSIGGPASRPSFLSLIKDAVRSESDSVKWAFEEVSRRATNS